MLRFKFEFQELDKQDIEQIYIAPMCQTAIYEGNNVYEALNKFKEEHDINNVTYISISKEN